MNRWKAWWVALAVSGAAVSCSGGGSTGGGTGGGAEVWTGTLIADDVSVTPYCGGTFDERYSFSIAFDNSLKDALTKSLADHSSHTARGAGSISGTEKIHTQNADPTICVLQETVISDVPITFEGYYTEGFAVPKVQIFLRTDPAATLIGGKAFFFSPSPGSNQDLPAEKVELTGTDYMSTTRITGTWRAVGSDNGVEGTFVMTLGSGSGGGAGGGTGNGGGSGTGGGSAGGTAGGSAGGTSGGSAGGTSGGSAGGTSGGSAGGTSGGSAGGSAGGASGGSAGGTSGGSAGGTSGGSAGGTSGGSAGGTGGCTAAVGSAANTWATGASMPTARFATGMGELSCVIYVAGGYAPTNHLTQVEAYAVATNSWSSKGGRPSVQTGPVSASIGSLLLVAGGSNASFNSPALTAYTPAGDSWAFKTPPMSSHGNNPGGGVLNGLFYVVGGNNIDNTASLSVNESYDPQADAWTVRSPMPTARGSVASAVASGILYVMGGIVNGVGPALNVVEAYDPTTNTWSTRAPMPTARYDAVAGTLNGFIYVVGGQSGTAGLSTVERYDPTTNSWTTRAAMPTARVAARAVVAAGKLFVIGGYIPPGTPLSTVEVYTP